MDKGYNCENVNQLKQNYLIEELINVDIAKLELIGFVTARFSGPVKVLLRH